MSTSTVADAHRQISPEKMILAGICCLILTLGMARFAYTPLLPIMREQADLSYVASGWLAAANYGGYMSGVLLTSFISNPQIKFQAYRIGLILAVISTIGMGLTTSEIVWSFWRFLGGLSGSAGLLLASGLILNHLVQMGRRPQLGVHFMGIGLGIIISGPIVMLTTGVLDWDTQWVILGIVGIAFLVPAWAWLPAPHESEAPTPKKKADTTEGRRARRWTQYMIAAYFCAGFGFVVGVTFIVAILEELPALAGLGGWLWVLVGIVATPATFLWDAAVRRFGLYPSLLATYGLQALAVLMTALSGNVLVNIVAAALFGATFVGVVSLTLTVVGHRFPDNPSKAMARITLGYGVAQIFAPAMTGYMAQAMHGYSGALVVSAIVLAIGMGLTYKVRQLEREA